MKNKKLASLLAFTLGIFGVHRFYLQQKKLGWLYLGFSWTLIPLLISFIDGISFIFMSYATFNRRYTLRHSFKKKYEDDEEILDFNTDEKLEQELLKKIEALESKERIEDFLRSAKERGEYLPRAVYARARSIISGKSNIYSRTLDIH
jgi:TM2 domain-containing membrane protein YozV